MAQLNLRQLDIPRFFGLLPVLLLHYFLLLKKISPIAFFIKKSHVNFFEFKNLKTRSLARREAKHICLDTLSFTNNMIYPNNLKSVQKTLRRSCQDCRSTTTHLTLRCFEGLKKSTTLFFGCLDSNNPVVKVFVEPLVVCGYALLYVALFACVFGFACNIWRYHKLKAGELGCFLEWVESALKNSTAWKALVQWFIDDWHKTPDPQFKEKVRRNYFLSKKRWEKFRSFLPYYLPKKK